MDTVILHMRYVNSYQELLSAIVPDNTIVLLVLGEDTLMARCQPLSNVTNMDRQLPWAARLQDVSEDMISFWFDGGEKTLIRELGKLGYTLIPWEMQFHMTYCWIPLCARTTTLPADGYAAAYVPVGKKVHLYCNNAQTVADLLSHLPTAKDISSAGDLIVEFPKDVSSDQGVMQIKLLLGMIGFNVIDAFPPPWPCS